MARTSVPTSTPKASGAASKKTVVASQPPPNSKGTKRVIFQVAAPHARKVVVCGSFNAWQPGKHPLKRDAAGVWKTQVFLKPGTYEYRYVVDGEWWDDPEATERVPNDFGSLNCVRKI
jgi:1,4-alpha-glucan branching enzyme